VKIVCLVKQVPRADAIEFDPETKQLRREGVPLLLNPFDAGAVAHGAALKERTGAEVIALTMGPPQAEEALRTCLALGADRCIHLSDRLFAVADTLGTSRTLSLAIEKEGGVDLVLCGRKTTDSETWQVPPETAAFLGWPHLTSVVETELRGRRIRAARETDRGFETFELEGPAVLSLAYGREAAETSDGRIDVWTAADLVDDVRENDKRFGQPGSPTRVLAVRDVTPERVGQIVESVDQAAERVRSLLAERRVEPSSWDKPEHIGEKPGKSYDCWTFVEPVDGRPSRASLELIGRGRTLAGKLGGENVALVLGHDVDSTTREAARHGAERVVVVEDDRLTEYHPEVWSHVLRSVVEQTRPHILLFPATITGRELGPRVAGELQLGMTGDCVGVDIARAGRLLQNKPAYGGNIVSVIMGRTTPQLATVRPRMFEPLEPREVEPRIERIDVGALPETRAHIVDRKEAPAWDLDEADVVVCAGPDLDALPSVPVGVALGGTREVCEQGQLPRNRQLGLYGRPVAPRLLVTVEVPGDFEHLTGFVKANVIVAIDRDGDAGMLRAADVGLIGEHGRLLQPLLDAVLPSL
jgi:electron transfer flavoprotein alpha/beta subunit